MTQLQLKNDFSKKVFDYLDLDDRYIQQLVDKPSIKMKDVAVLEVAEFFKSAHKLMICGDFDADGVTSTAIASLLAQALNIEYGFYIPDRIKDGYGTSSATIKLAHAKGYTHILMVDNGVKAQEAIATAKELGLKIAIVDHHNQDEPIQVDAFLHPDCLSDYGESMSAAGLMYIIAEALDLLSPMIQVLGAVGTIADVMPLWNKNREIVIKALEVLNSSSIPQVDILVKRTSYTHYTANFLAFNLIPKINSVGRLSDHGNMNTMVRYFLTQDMNSIKAYAQQVMTINDLRKKMTGDMSALALASINPLDQAHIITNPDFHEGILGIIANQILQETGKPSIVFKTLEDGYKGSSRSSSISLAEMFHSFEPSLFKAFGGHDFAYGLTIQKDALYDFKQSVNQYMDSAPEHVSQEDYISIDASLITKDALEELNQFEPFGQGFKMPMVKIDMPNSYSISEINGYGYKFVFNKGSVDEAVLFSKSYDMDQLRQVKSIIGTPSYNSFRKVSILVDQLIF